MHILARMDEESLNRVTALKAEGNALYSKKNFPGAEVVYTSALSLLPNESSNLRAVLLSNRAVCHLQREEYGSAMEDAKNAIEANKEYVRGYYRLGVACTAMGQYDDALKQFKIARGLCGGRGAELLAKRIKACKSAIRTAAFEEAIALQEPKRMHETISVENIPLESNVESLPRRGWAPRDVMAALVEGRRLPKREMAQLLLDVREYFLSQPSLVDVEIPPGGVLTVCGDTHGQFYDVVRILEDNGLPSLRCPYVFNGDYVDRGNWSVEILTLLFICMLHAPGSVLMLRGNHESTHLNILYGFAGEMKEKYDNTLYQLAHDVFSVMPIAAVVDGRVFLVHGGLPEKDTVTLKDIRELKRDCDIPSGGLMSDLLWNDPMDEKGRLPSKRGVGTQFGPDVTANFLKRNGLELVIRSHEVQDSGYKVAHDGKCITVFSAPNYYDSMGNLGAYIHLRHVEDKIMPEFLTFDAAPHPETRPMAYANPLFSMMQ